MNIEKIVDYLGHYDGPEMNIMEVCGSHTGAIAKNGIPGMLSDRIHLISGPGCPVCVTPSSYVDKLLELSLKDNTCIVTFGDLIRVPGSHKSLSIVKGEGARVEMVYSPLDIIDMAKKEPETTFIFAAVGFETTMPVYALVLQTLIEEDISNVKLLTALKTMPEVINWLCASGAPINAFIAPGHVSVITGMHIYEPIAEQYHIPFGVTGFSGEEILLSLYGIIHHYGQGKVLNYYPAVVKPEGNIQARNLVDTYFERCAATWRGIGSVEGSGRVLKQEYARFDAGSYDLTDDNKINSACNCDQVLMGKKRPYECPLFGKVCTPLTPQGACMVSTEGSCFSYYSNNRRD